MPEDRPLPITQERILICEGGEEAALFRALRDARDLPEFYVSCIGDGKAGPGITGLAKHLQYVIGLSGFSLVKHVAILADSDDEQEAAFRYICHQITRANVLPDVDGRYVVPTAAFTTEGSELTMTVLLQPGPESTGCLETLLWEILSRLYPKETTCVESLLECAGIKDDEKWTVAKLDKSRVRAAIAVINRRNPAQALSYLWDRDEDLIPATDEGFDALAERLAAI